MKIRPGVLKLLYEGRDKLTGSILFATFRCEQAKRLSNKFVFINETDGSNLTL
jgi:hypothetical protein